MQQKILRKSLLHKNVRKFIHGKYTGNVEKVAAGELSVDNAVLELKKEPFTAAGYDDLGFAKLDTHRKLRQGAAEVIYGAGKLRDRSPESWRQ